MTDKDDLARPLLGAGEAATTEARDAVARLVEELQAGWDGDDAEITDRSLAADVAWGSPHGSTVHGYDRLHAIHVGLKAKRTGGSSSRFEVGRVLAPSPGVAIAHIRRLALGPDGQPMEDGGATPDGAFSEMALYVLVQRDGRWWVAAGQNTPITPGGAA